MQRFSAMAALAVLLRRGASAAPGAPATGPASPPRIPGARGPAGAAGPSAGTGLGATGIPHPPTIRKVNPAGSEIRQPLGYAIVGGLILSRLLTLFATPVVYLYLGRVQGWSRERRKGLGRVEPEALAAE